MEEGVLFERSLDDVRGMISHAKLIESDLLPLSQVVRQEQMSQQIPSYSPHLHKSVDGVGFCTLL